MALVDYSDSDESGTDGTENTAPVKATTNTTKPTVQKIVDRSNPGKIKVSLPQASSTTESNPDENPDEPPAKRVKTGGGLFGGLASFLPPPIGVVGKITLGGSVSRKGGLGAGVNLRTGAAPGFSREPEPAQEKEPDSYRGSGDGSYGNGLHSPPPKKAESSLKPEEVRLVGKPLMFKPLCVARKSVKKKKQQTTGSGPISAQGQSKGTESTNQVVEPQKRAKVSLFSMSTEPSSAPSVLTTGNYQPLIYEPEVQKAESSGYHENPDNLTASISIPPASLTAPIFSAQSLDSIAQDLNLSAADRRQLFGRQKSGYKNNNSFQATKIINFNTDQEYAHNEELRASGEEVAHNPVKSIAPGKHSLKQLVRVAQTQKEALEESFVKGKTNRAEASSRYGW